MLGCAIGLLSGAQRRQHHNNERKGNFSHQRFYHDLEYSQEIIGTPPIFFPLPLRNCQLPLKNGRSKTNDMCAYRFHYGRPNRRARRSECGLKRPSAVFDRHTTVRSSMTSMPRLLADSTSRNNLRGSLNNRRIDEHTHCSAFGPKADIRHSSF